MIFFNSNYNKILPIIYQDYDLFFLYRLICVCLFSRWHWNAGANYVCLDTRVGKIILCVVVLE